VIDNSATSGRDPAAFSGAALVDAVGRVREPVRVVARAGDIGRGVSFADEAAVAAAGLEVVGQLPALYPEWLGDGSFRARHGLRFPYVAGAMANGIATAGMVIAMADAGFLAFFGAGGLALPRIAEGIDRIGAALRDRAVPWGANLIHSPQEPALEDATAALYIARGVRLVSASAFMGLTPAVVHYAASGLSRLPDGRVVRRHRVFAKISRAEVAGRFLSPPPASMLETLVADGRLTVEEAALAATLPVATELIVEADSGGHTDNRPLPALFGTIAALRDELAERHGYAERIHVGAAGGLGTPEAVAAAFALGASFVLTGSVNQAAVESGLSPAGRELLARAGVADVEMCAAADMFELGVKLQVLRRGTMFAGRANKLYEVYRAHSSWAEVPAEQRAEIERGTFGMSFDDVRARTEAFWRERDPRELERAAADPRHRMALCFRWYLGLSSRWAIAGDEARKLDWQIWCGPSMGAFNAWVRGSFLEPASQRTVVQIARNLMQGAAVITRAQQLRSVGVALPTAAWHYSPRPLG